MLALVMAPAVALGPASQLHAGSDYGSLAAERSVGARTTLLYTTVHLARRKAVLLESDGSYAPLDPSSAGRVLVEVDGWPASDGSTLDWRGSLAPEEHSFNAVGVVSLGAGNHPVALVGEPLDRFAGPFVFGQRATWVCSCTRPRTPRRAFSVAPRTHSTSARGGP